MCLRPVGLIGSVSWSSLRLMVLNGVGQARSVTEGWIGRRRNHRCSRQDALLTGRVLRFLQPAHGLWVSNVSLR